jgi:hypothetical protein
LDIKIETESEKPVYSGTIVEWFRESGQWIVLTTTGIVAKIRDLYGKEVLANCRELKLCQN